MEFLLIGAGIAVVIVWAISVRCRLAGMDESVNNAMRQIGVQLSSRLDVLSALLELSREYASCESLPLLESLRARRSFMTQTASPEDVLKQERLISEALGYIRTLAEQRPALKAHSSYGRCLSAADSYEKMIRTSRLIYNDSVATLNRELRTFPTSLLGRMFGFRCRAYLETAEAGPANKI